jgi:pimeloyl-ACP methyl ester carboxylesterase
VRDTETTLPDGRTMAYTDLGAPDGLLVLYFHGAPTSRLDVVGLDDEFAGLGLRCVAPDRPGYGGSSPQPGRRIEDWPRDVAALLDVLHVDRCAVIGLSSGGPYAVVCAALLDTRVSAAGVLAGVTDFGWPDAWIDGETYEEQIKRAPDEVAAIAEAEEALGADGSRFADHVTALAPADDAMLADPENATRFFTTVTEAFRQGVAGFAEDQQAEGRAWAFDPGAISVPVEIWHGADDTLVPRRHAEHTAAIIPTARLRILPDHGHLSIINELPALADVLTRTPGS